MPLRVRDLLALDGLALRAVTGESGLDRLVSWVAPTELADPTPWMNGGELILTTGLRLRAAAAQRTFVEQLADAGAAGIGFGTGLSHTTVPRALLAAAQQRGLPVLEVPYETPFIALGRRVAEQIAAERHSAQRRLVDVYDRLTQAVLAGDPLGQLLRTLSRQLGAAAAVVTPDGGVLAGSPPGEPAHRLAVELDGAPVAWLLAGATDRPEPLPYAARLAGLELARRLSYTAGRRAQLGSLLTELLADRLGPAAEHVLALHGIDPATGYRVVLGTWSGAHDEAAGRRLARLAWSLAQFGEHEDEVPGAVVDGCLLLLVPADQDAEPQLKGLWQALAADPLRGGSAAVSAGGGAAGLRGLQEGYLDARTALTRGAGLQPTAAPAGLVDLLLSQPSSAVRQLSARLLEPLTRFDAEHRADLIGTLERFLVTDGSVQATADQLFVHRNTVRYRLSQIEELTGRSLASTADRAELWLALRTPGSRAQNRP